MVKVRHILIAQTIMIILLAFASVYFYSQMQKFNGSQPQDYSLLSKKISYRAMEEKSLAIVNFNPLKIVLEDHIRGRGINTSIYVENLRNGAYMGIGERNEYLPASLNKLVLAILIMKKVEEGKLSLDSELKISESDRLSSSGELYRTTDEEIPLNIVIGKMLSESDNTAFSILLHYVTEEDIEFILDYYNLDISLDFEGGESRKHSNTISPKSMSNLFLSLYFSTVLEAKNSEYLLSLMNDNVFDISQIAGIPEDVEVAHKFGEHYLNSTKIFHDCGIMYAGESRIFYCIMSKDMEKEDSVENAAFITRSLYEYVNAVKVKYGTK